jgi:pyrimidine-nucleoside phosphorylase
MLRRKIRLDYLTYELISKKKKGEANTTDEIRWLIRSYTNGDIPDYQMAAWAMAVWFRGMTDEEISVFTESMRDSGEKFNFSALNAPRIDKHSTGGVGDKTTLIVGPIMAAAKVHVPMIAGRALGHTGGTLDKFMSIPGFRIHLTPEEFKSHVAENYLCLISQSEKICPADRKLYALRDVTATVDSLALICGSIMSKKLAEDLTHLVLDVKFGSGAFMRTLSTATQLANLLKTTGERNGVKVSALLTNMNEPLGRFAGNAVEVRECYDILCGVTAIENGRDYYEPTRELSLALAGQMLYLVGKAQTAEGGVQLATEILKSGAARIAFDNLLKYQGPAQIEKLPEAKFKDEIRAKTSGYVRHMNTEAIGVGLIELGAGRKKSTDEIDATAGLEMCCRIGDQVQAGQCLIKIFANSNSYFQVVSQHISAAIEIGATPPAETLPLIAKVLT